MKKTIKTKLAVIGATCLMFMGFGVFPLVTNAEDIQSVYESNAEIDKNLNETPPIEDFNEVQEPAEKTPEITVDLNNITYEQFLEIVGVLAEETGNVDLWKQTVESVKKAINEKQFTASNLLMILVCIVTASKTIYDWVVRKKEKDHISATKETNNTLQGQSKAINELIDVEEHVSDTVDVVSKKEQIIAKAGIEQNAALRAMARGIQLHETARKEVFRHLNNSDDLYEDAKA